MTHACCIQEEALKCINCQGDYWANNRDCSIIIKQRAIISIPAVENISIVDAKNCVESEMLTSTRSFPATLLKNNNNNNFPTLSRNRKGETFENSNRFDFLGVEESKGKSLLYMLRY